MAGMQYLRRPPQLKARQMSGGQLTCSRALTRKILIDSVTYHKGIESLKLIIARFTYKQ